MDNEDKQAKFEPKKRRGRGRPVENNRQVRCVETGEVFENYREAARAVGGNRSAMYLVVNGWRPTHMGKHFEYMDDI